MMPARQTTSTPESEIAMKHRSGLPQFLLFSWCAVVSVSTPAAQKQSAAVRVTTRLVEVNVVVQDRKGAAVRDMARDDFEVTEEGKPQTIATFSLESNLKTIGRTEPLPPNAFSNIPSQAGASQNLTAVLFDTLNTPIEDQVNARRELVRFLRQIEPQDRVAVFGLGTSLQVIHDFTGSSAALVRAIEHYGNRLSLEQANPAALPQDNGWLAENEAEAKIIAAMDEVVNRTAERINNYYIQRRTTITLQALEAIADHIAPLPGRKCLIWISDGFPLTYGSNVMRLNQLNEGVKNFSEIVSRTARSLTNANVAIYPVDARALMTLGSITHGAGISLVAPNPNATGARAAAREAARIDDQATDEVFAARTTMKELADQTGGRASFDTNDARSAIRQALEDSRVTYTLGYYPTDPDFNGKFRSIKVSVKRPGLQVRYRRGYFAFPDEPIDAAHRDKALNAATVAMIDATSVGFMVEVGKPASGNSARQLAISVDTNSIKLQEVEGKWVGGLDAMFAQFDTNGNALKSTVRKVPLVLSAEDREQLLQHGLVLNLPAQLKENCTHLRIVLRDVKSGLVGRVTVPLADLR